METAQCHCQGKGQRVKVRCQQGGAKSKNKRFDGDEKWRKYRFARRKLVRL